jgi:rubrerythrin
MTSIIEQAIGLEAQAEGTYRDAAKATSDPSAGKILGLLADEEARHARMLRQRDDVRELEGSDLLDEARGWIQGIVEGGASSISSDLDLLAVLRRALEMERATEAFYRKHSNDAGDPPVSKLFSTLADIEKTHFLLVGNWIEYFNRPSEWVESAEFGQRVEY